MIFIKFELELAVLSLTTLSERGVRGELVRPLIRCNSWSRARNRGY